MTMSDTEIPKIRISAPEELIELVPYLIGFHPTESLVLIGFDANTNQVQLGMRVDLPSSEVTEAELEANVTALVHPLQRSQVDEVVAILFTADPEQQPRRSLQLGQQLNATLEQFHIGVLDLLVVTDTHWWSMLCADITCCPVGGSPRVKASVAATKATYAGLIARPSREDLGKVFEGEPDPERYQPALANAEQRFTEAVLINRTRKSDAALIKAEARRHVDDPELRLTVPQLARIAVALTDIIVRDEIWLAIDDGGLEADRLLVELFTRLPQPYLAPPLFLYGWAAWRRGDGTLAGMAVERALDADPGYSAARMLQVAVSEGLDPRSTPKLREGEADDHAQQ